MDDPTTATIKSSDSDGNLPLAFPRGGGCSDSSPILFLKIGASAALETASLLGLFLGGKAVSDNSSIPWIWPKWIAILSTVFGSSIVGSIIDGGVSAASKQAFDPNAIPGDADWYEKLKKPWWNPPGWLFPIMWLIVSKPTQAVALNNLLENKESIPWGPLAVYCAHLSLGDAWNKVFFGLQCVGRGAGVITGFFGSLLSSTFLFFKTNSRAGQFMLPTCGWVAVATALNWSIFFKNK
jgi:tryptophan-rich sensory protein